MSNQPTAADRRHASAQVLLDRPDELDRSTIELDHAAEHHLRRVLRLREGESVSVTDGAGRWRIASVRTSADGLRLDPDGAIATERRDRPPLTIATAIPKGDRVEWLVQKCTELGADRIVLLHAERSVVRWSSERAAKQLERLRRIADEATRQSRRVWRTEVSGPTTAREILPVSAAAEPGGRALRLDDRTISLGPEGGWTDAELQVAGSLVDLGPHVLRTETAAVAATARSVAFGH
jgi:16S rRNA (uracil1498-N3)-methyltransferase